MTMLTCLRETVKARNLPIKVYKAPSSFTFISYEEEINLSEKYVFENGAITAVVIAWIELNKP